jgi:hypothetical protein
MQQQQPSQQFLATPDAPLATAVTEIFMAVAA